MYTVYRGDFSNNLIDGHGIMRYYNGDVYEGKWENGLVCAGLLIVILNYNTLVYMA